MLNQMRGKLILNFRLTTFLNFNIEKIAISHQKSIFCLSVFHRKLVSLGNNIYCRGVFGRVASISTRKFNCSMHWF